jgi:hypothetical protein
MYCGMNAPSATLSISSFKRSNLKKAILVASIAVVLIIIGGAFYHMSQPQSVPRRETAQLTPTVTPEQTPQTPSLAINEEERIRDMVMAYYEAFNRHSESDQMGFFTDNVTVLINHGKDYSYHGPKEKMKSYLSLAFQLDPQVAITDLRITRLTLEGDTATVESEYIISSKVYQFSKPINEHIELVKTNNAWKIAKTDIVV